MVAKSKQAEELKALVEAQVLQMLQNSADFSSQERMNLKLAIDYLKIKVAWEDDFGTGFADALEADATAGPGEGEFTPPSATERAEPSVLTTLDQELPNV